MTNKGYLEAKRTPESDEWYTPSSAVKPLLKYLEWNKTKYRTYDASTSEWTTPNITIWCPFDTEHSQFVKVLSAANYNVIYSHIDEGKDFFAYEPEEPYDFIVSNPPFSRKDDVLKRLYELGKPYAMLLPLPTLQGVKRFPYIKDCQALVFDNRVQYFKDLAQTELSKGASFGSIYICRNFLPKDLIFEELEKE